MTPRALVRPPSPRLADGIVTHIERSEIDYATALRQWHGYVEALDRSGWQTVEVERADDCPDGVFIEDAVVVYGDLAVVARSGADTRRAELPSAQRAVEAAGYRVTHIEAPGTLDGGDVLKVGSTVYVGQGGRTNADGLAQFADHLAPLGARVVAVPVTRALHLKSAVTALPDGTVIGHPTFVDDPGAFDAFLAVPEPSGSHVVILDDDRLLMADSAPETAALLEARGYRPVLIDISQFERLEGCVTCLSVRLRG